MQEVLYTSLPIGATFQLSRKSPLLTKESNAFVISVYVKGVHKIYTLNANTIVLVGGDK